MSVGAVNKQTGDRIPTAGMPAIDDALDLTSVNPVQNAIITAALANKQDKTDNSLQTTDKTVVGAINEHEGDIDSLKSGLTNYQTQNDINLEVPDRKNIAGYTLDDLKSSNTEGTWNNNVYTIYDVSFTCNISNGFVTSIIADSNGQTVQNQVNLRILYSGYKPNIYGGMLLNGCNSNNNKIFLAAFYSNNGTSWAGEKAQFDGTDVVISNNYPYIRFGITINDGVIVNNVTFYPMIRPATIADSTFAPYIPSVDARLDAVESGLTNIAKGYYTSYNDYTKWYHIGNITIPVIKWIRHMSIISVNGSDIRHLIFRSVPTDDKGFDNNETKVVGVYSSTTSAATVGLIISGDKKSVDIYIKGGNLGNRTYSVLSDGGEGTVDYYNPVETDLTDADMTITG